jgi:hypothetical protein
MISRSVTRELTVEQQVIFTTILSASSYGSCNQGKNKFNITNNN